MALLQPTDVTAVEVGFSALWSRYDYLCASIPDAKKKLGRDFVELGDIVNDVREHQLWGARGYQTIGAFVEATGEKVGLKRGQIYDAAATVRLLPSVSKTDMLELGIVRASALKNLAKATGVQPSTEMIAWAKANKSEVVKDEIYTKIHGEPPEGQDYFTINYVATPGQQETIQKGFDLAAKMANFPENLPEHNKTAATLEVIMQEFIGTYEGQVV